MSLLDAKKDKTLAKLTSPPNTGTKLSIEHNGSEAGEVQENCCKCGNPTRYWFGTGYRNVALCERCASTYTEEDLPTKAEWIATERAKNPRPFWSAR